MTTPNTVPNQENEDATDFIDSNEFKKVDFIERKNISEILPSGQTYTLNSVVDWVEANIERLKEILSLDSISSHDVIKAYVWGFRYNNGQTQYISFDLRNTELDIGYSFNFTIGGEFYFHLEEPTVPDCVEALHMIGLITTALNINAVIGSHQCEQNEYCRAKLNLKEFSSYISMPVL